ncbi:MAG: hypothetical protein KAV18_04820, partial [Candidatus Omnitrophica bacterium]|nr:hypothetical protein [Candidatus Omnitrophota bacterium]
TTFFKCGSVAPVGTALKSTPLYGSAKNADCNNEELICSASEKFELYQNAKICESDFEQCYQTALKVLDRVIPETIQQGYTVSGLLITSQAQTFVPVDEHFNPLSKGIVWLDSRAEDEEKYLIEQLPDFQKTAGLSQPSSALYGSKLLWFKNNKPDIYKKAKYFPLINEFIVYKLTGKFYSDYTNFSMGGVLDIRKKKLNTKILEILELSADNFPEIKEAVSISYNIKAELKKRFDLKNDVPVYFCGNDQSVSAAGAGIKRVGEISANFGTAMVVYTYLDNLPDVIAPYQMAGISPVAAEYFILSVETVGNIIDNVKNTCFPEISYDEFFSKYYIVKDIDLPDDIKVVNGQLIGLDEFDPDKQAGFTVKYFLNRFCFHLSQIEKQVKAEKLYISGGIAKSSVWIDLLKENIDQQIILNNTREAGLIGAVKIYKKARLRGTPPAGAFAVPPAGFTR